MDISIVVLIKKLFWRVLIYIFSFLAFWLFINWWFLLFFGRKIFTYWWPWGMQIVFILVITLLLFIIFPACYFILMKKSYVETVVTIVWQEYRSDFINTLIVHIAAALVQSYQATHKVLQWSDVNALFAKIFNETSFWSKLLVQYLTKRVTLLDQLAHVVTHLSEDDFQDRKSLQQKIAQWMQPYFDRTDVARRWSLYWLMRLVLINILLLLGLALLVM